MRMMNKGTPNKEKDKNNVLLLAMRILDVSMGII
jgi:hypothetical protein